MKPIRAMLFDLDGTLLDSAPDLVGSLNWVRGSENLDPLPVSKMSRHASKGAVGLLNAGMPQTDPDRFETWRLLFLEHYADNLDRNSKLYDGIPELLDFLGREGIPWGVVTNKIESLTLPIIKALDLQDAISCVVCGDTLEKRKPHPAPVNLACRILGEKPAETVFAGDDVRDIQAGKAAGTQTAAIHYGYGSYELTRDHTRGSHPVHHPSDLLMLVKDRQPAAV